MQPMQYIELINEPIQEEAYTANAAGEIQSDFFIRDMSIPRGYTHRIYLAKEVRGEYAEAVRAALEKRHTEIQNLLGGLAQ